MNQIKTILLLGVLSSILLGIGALFAPGQLWVFGAIVVVMNLVSYFFSDKIVLAMHRAKPISEQQDPALHQMVAELARAAGIPKPRVFMLDDDTPNAFATGRNPSNGVVAVTRGIRGILTDRELRGVLAHELSHIKNRDILVATIAAMIAGVISMLANILQWSAIMGGGRDDRDDRGSPAAMLVLAIVAPIAASLVQLAISRQREFGADHSGGLISGDPGALADALLKLERGAQRIPVQMANAHPATASLFIVNPLRGDGLMRLFSTHPSTEQRVARLRALQNELGKSWTVPRRA
jgi:heat shock protein HtpX